ncbi:unnamed protein product [Acanthoscelides obtectus]|uniref:Uncharacterized protein n=1 Tax=Acanthoscelides obtectus TaxID=200917 RepID=A0A9P0PCM4_ACAOB|nr:unnamed protein product [Acanthoscelides obtectus]CAK1655111.1 hypothetical protein AOBTE_LOCUS19032 [Acanthoscelides obtectus]
MAKWHRDYQVFCEEEDAANPAGSLGQKHHISTLVLQVYHQNVRGLRTKLFKPKPGSQMVLKMQNP